MLQGLWKLTLGVLLAIFKKASQPFEIFGAEFTPLPVLFKALVTIPSDTEVSQTPRTSNLVSCLVGFAYGGIIATYPAAIAILFPGEDGPLAYGRIFTAWGTAGLLAPWLAGQI